MNDPRDIAGSLWDEAEDASGGLALALWDNAPDPHGADLTDEDRKSLKTLSESFGQDVPADYLDQMRAAEWHKRALVGALDFPDDPTALDRLKDAPKRLARGAVRGTGLMATGAGALMRGAAPYVPTTPLMQVAGTKLGQVGETIGGAAPDVDPRLSGEIGMQALEGLGTSAPIIAVGAATGGLGAGSALAAGAVGGASALVEAGSGYETARERGESEETAQKAAYLTAPLGFLDAIPEGSIAARLVKRSGSGGLLARLLSAPGRLGAAGGLALTGATEAAQEGVQGVGEEVVQRLVGEVQSDADAESLWKVAQDNATPAALSGVFMEAALRAVTKAKGALPIRRKGAEVVEAAQGSEVADLLWDAAPEPEVAPAPEPVQAPVPEVSESVSPEAKSAEPESVTDRISATTERVLGEQEAKPLLDLTRPEASPEVPAETKAEPEPVAAEEPKATGVKNRTVDAELAEMGLPPAQHGESRSDAEVYGKAKEAFEKDADSARRLVDSLHESQRPATDDETALLTFEVNKRIREREAAEEAYRSDPSEENQKRIERAKEDYAKAADVVTQSGTESGRAFRLRRMMLARDYSLAAMERATDVASGGKASAERQAKVASLHEQLAEIDRLIADREARVIEIEQREALKKEVRARKKRGAAAVEEYLAPKAEAALKRLAAATTARSGPALTAQNISDAAIVGAHLIAKGAAKFEAWSAQMVDAIGEHIRPHLNAVWEEAQSIHTDAPKERGRLKGAKTRTRTAIKGLEQRIEEQDFSKPERKEIEPDQELLDLRTRKMQLVREYKQDLFQYEQERRTPGKKALDAAREARGLVGNILTAFDMSAVLRQGIFYTLSHPIQSGTNLGKALKAAKSQAYYDKLNTAIHTRSNYEAGRRAGLELTDVGDVLTPQEEMMRSRIANKIPGLVHSNRGFTVYLNLQRVQAFDALYDGYPGQMTPQVAREIAAKVNTATGRGNVRGAERVIKSASEVLFSPKLYLSRLQLLTGQPLWGGDPYVRKAFARDYARFITAIGAIYALNAMMGGDPPETDPRSSDFSKLRFGNTRVDVTGGLGQYTVLLGQMAAGERKVLASGKVEQANRGDTLARFLRNKLSPVFGAGTDVLQGKNTIGEPVTPLDAAAHLVVPLQFQDIAEVMEEQGAAKGSALALLGFFGASLQTFDEKEKANEQRRRRMLRIRRTER